MERCATDFCKIEMKLAIQIAFITFGTIIMPLELQISPALMALLIAFSQEAVDNAVDLLAPHFSIDVEEAKEVVRIGGIVKQTIPISAMPWTGTVNVSNCKALTYNQRLFTQCTKACCEVDGSMSPYCKACNKQVAQLGTPKYGDVEARLACGLMEYKIGKNTVVPFSAIMAKEKWSQEEVERAARVYGMTIDPCQYVEKEKKRGRPPAREMTVPEPSEVEGAPEHESPAEETSPEPERATQAEPWAPEPEHATEAEPWAPEPERAAEAEPETEVSEVPEPKKKRTRKPTAEGAEKPKRKTKKAQVEPEVAEVSVVEPEVSAPKKKRKSKRRVMEEGEIDSDDSDDSASDGKSSLTKEDVLGMNEADFHEVCADFNMAITSRLGAPIKLKTLKAEFIEQFVR